VPLRTTFPLLPALFLAVLGCAEPDPAMPDVPPPSPPTAPASSRFDPASAADVRGRIVWRGPVPAVPPLEHPRKAPGGLVWGRFPNPHTPSVTPDGAVAGAVVFLRGIDPAAGRPWDHPPASVEVRSSRMVVAQGGERAVGWVRPGDPVGFANRDQDIETVRAATVGAGGGLLFTLPLPDPDQPLSRALRTGGPVELSSGSGHYWMRAWLWVTDHPYFAITDARGRFELPAVPPGRYEAVCWHPNWHRTGHDRDPETGLVIRQHFAPPAEKVVPLEVTAGVNLELRLPLDSSDFPAPPGAD
jgi:hypothetical protein